MSAVLATYVSTIDVNHNEVYDLPYSGLTVGYGWGSNDAGRQPRLPGRGLYNYQPGYTTATTAPNNHVNGNYVHDVMQPMNDGACMYTLSDSPGSTLNGNYCLGHRNYLGFYFDEGSRHYSATGNVFRQTGTWAHENDQGGNHTGNLTLTGNWTSNTGADVINGSRGDAVTGTVAVTTGNWPSGARAAMDAAGIEPAYRATTTDAVAAPYSAYSSVPANIGQSGSTLTLSDAGADTWGAGGEHADEYSTAYVKGSATDGTTVTARVDQLDATDPWAKAGVVLRNDLTGSGSSTGYAIMVATPGHGVSFQYDAAGTGYLDTFTAAATGTTAPVWVRLTRTGNNVAGSYSTDGTTFTQVGSTVALAAPAATQDAGVIHTAHAATAGSAVLSNLTITTSARRRVLLRPRLAGPAPGGVLPHRRRSRHVGHRHPVRRPVRRGLPPGLLRQRQHRDRARRQPEVRQRLEQGRADAARTASAAAAPRPGTWSWPSPRATASPCSGTPTRTATSTSTPPPPPAPPPRSGSG